VLANALASAFVSARRAQILASGAPLRNQLETELASLRHDVNITTPTPARFVARAQYQTVLRQLTALTTSAAQATRSVYVASSASSGHEVGAPFARDMGIGLLAGLIVGVLLALLVRGKREITEVLGAPVLGRVPGSIVLAHMNHPASGAAAGVAAALPALRAAGWEFVPLAGQELA